MYAKICRDLSRLLAWCQCWCGAKVGENDIIRLSYKFYCNQDLQFKRTVSMDPGTILAVVTTSATVLYQITNYYLDVKGARQDRDRLHNEVKALHHVLENVKTLAEGSNTSKLLSVSSYLKESCSSDIKDLEIKLNPGKGRKAMKKLGVRALKWPFDKNEVDEYINRLERHKTTITITLGMDQM